MLPSGLPRLVKDDEDLVRFLTQSNQFNATIVKPAAFLPSPKDQETSVFRHGKEPKDNLRKLGVLAAGGRSLYGVALFNALSVRNARLEVASDEPPPLHAVIRGWPWIERDQELQKARQKELAALISSDAGPPILF